ncbi:MULTISPECIES: FtsK/SpoIIIE domain-containing protein [Micromonospora]|uniref:Cell division protein FtsK n=1 Tax=Micromonospora solifontis TaxID=2487138 RepID=A0ABX9WB52_9ACTN|nr:MULTISPECIES: FtsK/SpoIIIE domain-containing protein [Micromonospora]NES12196.1 TraM recognition domain-containing protein [Micromonospora sp. PPF5-17B]NES39544.1 TraM recognition domain-containing protein [Micromonospora solifontis]NES54321.1 TraM recognition domain-containing protein [Micromonospora sp. PPF5-6]RNL88253.1 cell division protein FtsK [Micromonospora solifontis]
MSRLAAAYGQALALHRQALRRWEAVRRSLAAAGPPAPGSPELVARLARLGAALAAPAPGTAHPVTTAVPVRVGEATTFDGGFPVLVPLAGGNHLAVDADARDPRVGELLRAVVTQLLAAAPAGTVRVAGIDPAAFGAAFLPLRPLLDAGVLGPTATTAAEVATLLDDAERHARAAQHAARDDQDLLLLVAASAPAPRELARLAALTHAGAPAAVCVLLAGYPATGPGEAAPPLGATTQLRLGERYALVGDPPGRPYSGDGAGLAAPVVLDGDPSHATVTGLARRLAAAARRAEAVTFADLLPPRRWAESAAAGLRTVLGRALRPGAPGAGVVGGEPVTVAFDDATPHWLVGGRTGAGKTVFLLDVLYGLAARYAPTELRLLLLDFKEGVSFTEFVPTERDPSWLPHARAVGIESDREYGVAVLRELRDELTRRADLLKRHGVSKLADLPAAHRPPRIVTVVDEFHVLFAGNDALARQAVDLLEELARKGRSYGLHLVLASQSTTGVEALYGRAEAIFGQFPLRVALPGGAAVLDPLNEAAKALTVGTAVVNTAGGAAGADTLVRFPDAHAAAADLATLRHELCEARPAGAPPPTVFRGYETPRLADDPTWAGLRPDVAGPPLALVGRTVDVAGSPAAFRLDATPGRHLGVVGTAAAGADVLRSAALSLARQHAPGTARFLLAPLAPDTTGLADDLAMTLAAARHPVRRLDAAELRAHLADLAAGGDPAVVAPPAPTDAGPTRPAGAASGGPHAPSASGAAGRTYLVVFGVDAAAGVLAVGDPATFRSGHDDLRAVLRDGPARGVHLLGWWRGLRRLGEDLGGSQHRDDLACLVALNVPGADLGLYLGAHDLAYAPRDGRALLVDRHDQRTALMVPFVGDGDDR